MKRLSIRLPVWPPLWRGALVVVVGVGVATCRVGDLFSVPEAGLIFTIPGPDQGADSVLTGSAAFGSKALQVMKVSVGHTGKSQLQWKARVGGGSPWLSILNTTGQSGDTIQVVGDPKNLTLDSYRDSVIVDNTSASGSVTVPVSFVIHDCTVGPIPDAGGDSSSTLNSADCAAPHNSGRQAQFYSFNGVQGNVATILLSSAFDGFVALDSSRDTAAAPLATATQCLGDPKSPCIYYFSLPRNTTYYIEVSGATAADTGAFDVRLISGSGRNPNVVIGLEQRLLPDSSQVVAIGGAVGANVLIHGVVADSDVVDSIRLQAEWAPLGQPFQGVVMSTGPFAQNGQVASATLGPLLDNTAYHWQVRAVDQRGNFSSQGTQWDSLARGTSPDFTVQIGHNPNPPANLVQLQSDGATQIPTGGYATTTTVKFRGQVSDQDVGDVLHLEVEVQPVGTDTAGAASPNQTFTTASSGNTSTATVIAPTIQDRTSYHWIARAVDQGGRRSTWAGFGGNAETQVDFRDSVANTFNLVFTSQPPAQVTAGNPLSVEVTAQNALGQTITSFNGNVTMSLASGPSGGALSGTTSATAQSGVATLNNLILTKVGSYTLLATSGVTNSQPSTSVAVNFASPAQLTFTTPPSNTVSGQPIAPAVKVTVQDAYANTVTNYPTAVSLALQGPAGGTLTGGGPVAPVTGVATFAGLSIDKTGTGYTLRATSGTLPAVASTAFNITPGPATHLVFAVPPSSAQANATIAPPVQVAGQDANDNLATSFTATITLAIGPNPPSNGILSGAPPTAAVSGIATFSNLSIDKIGTGYTLIASGGGLQITSGPFNISNQPISPTLSSVAAAPTTITASSGASASTITVTARDLSGQPVQGASVALTATGSGNTLTQPVGTTNASGVATGTLSSTTAETKTVSATINSVSINQQATVTVNPAGIASLVLTLPIGNTVAGAAINGGAGVVVTARDAFGNTATSFASTVTMAIVAGPGPFAPTSVNSAPASAGVAPFTGLRIYQAGAGYQIQAASGAFTSAPSNSFNITVAPAVRDTFDVQPTTTPVSAPINGASGGIQVRITDSVGNTVTSDNTHTITMAVASGPSFSLGGTKVKMVQAGVATFTDLSLPTVGTYTLSARSNLTSNPTDISAPFDIVAGPAAKLAITTAPSSGPQSGVAFAQQPVIQVQDASGNPVSQSGTLVSATIQSSPGGSPSLTNQTATTNASGAATFSGLAITGIAGPYTLSFSSSRLTPVTSGTINLTAGQATKLALTTAPSTSAQNTQAFAQQPVIQLQDNSGNPVSQSGVLVTAAIANSPGGTPSLSSATATTNASGAATFSGLAITGLVGPYTLTFGASGLTSVGSGTITLSAGTATKLGITTPPSSSAQSGQAFPRQPVIQIQDVSGNGVSQNGTLITATVASKPGGSPSLTNPTATTGAGGAATFSGLAITGQTGDYTLNFGASGLSPVVSGTITLSSGTATQLGITTQPSTSAQSGIAIPQQPAIQLLDVINNPVSQSGVVITATINSPPVGSSLVNATATTNASGLATFSGLAISGTVGSYTLHFASGSLTAVNSNSIALSAGPASQLVFTTQPSTTTAGQTIGGGSGVEVTAEDAQNNVATTFGGSVSIAITSGSGTTGALLSGTIPFTAASGVATFSDLSIDSAGTNYTLRATSGSFNVTSTAFAINPGAVGQLTFTVGPTDTPVNTNIAPAITVTAKDAIGNLVAATSVSIAIGSVSASGTLNGTTTVTTVNGVATFSDLQITVDGSYTLKATAGAVSSGDSNSFNITP